MKSTLVGFLSLCFLITATTLPAAAQSGESDDIKKLRTEGAEAMQSGDWASAIETFGELASTLPNDKVVRFQLGYAQHASGLYQQAIASYESMLAIDGPHPLNPVAMYNLGCAHALDGDSEEAFAWLGKAVDNGFNQTAQITSDGDLVSLRTDVRFAKLVERVDRNAHPCKYDERNRALDFWVGSWNVYTPAGQPAGQNMITRVLDDCVVHEAWGGSFGMKGMSYNFFDDATGKWHQTWVDDKGGSYLFTGEIVDGSMVFERSATDDAGVTTITQMILTPNDDGTVTQEGRSSTDDGANWTTNWKLVYHRQGDHGGGEYDKGDDRGGEL